MVTSSAAVGDGGDHVTGLGQVRGAGHVGDHAAGPDRVDGRVEQLALHGGELGHVVGGLAPPGFGTAAQRAEAGARDVGQHAVERARRPRAPGARRRRSTADRSVRGGWCGAAGAAQGVQDPAGPVRADVGGDQAGAARGGQAAQQPGLAARARAQVEPEPVRAGARRRQGQADAGQGERGELAGLVLDGGLAAGDQGGRVAAGQPQAVGRPAGRLGRPAGGLARSGAGLRAVRGRG